MDKRSYSASVIVKKMIDSQRPPHIQAVVSVAMTALVYLVYRNWTQTVILLVSLLFHEWGHWMMYRHNGMRSRIIFLLPVGAATIPETDEELLKLNQLHWWRLSWLCLAGPAVNLFLMALSHLLTGYTDWAADAVAINGWLVIGNLLPLSISDGGLIARSVFHSVKRTTGYWIANASVMVSSLAAMAIVSRMSGSIDYGWWNSLFAVVCLLLFAIGIYSQYRNVYPHLLNSLQMLDTRQIIRVVVVYGVLLLTAIVLLR